VPGSQRVVVSYEQEVRTEPAAGELLELEGGGSAYTDANGLATFAVKRSAMSSGVLLRHAASGRSYFLHRVIRQRTTTVSAASIANAVRKLAVGAGPEGVVVMLFIEEAALMVIGHVIDTLGTTTVPYLDWVVRVK
jgi:hypothetical protein